MKAAEDADKAAKDKLAAASDDNLITPEESGAGSAQTDAETLKAAADQAVKALPTEPEAVVTRKTVCRVVLMH
ncbi:hypothetical protein OHD52_26660 [Escherichia coli]|nr:hypothetical protein [Escherichia coli]